MNARIDRFGSDQPDWPVILSVPHAGRDYPPELADDCRFPADRLLPLEDRLADHIALPAFKAGFSGVVARTPRAMIDLNRAETDMDPAMLSAPMAHAPILSAKTRGGLGLVPRRTGALGDLWRRRFSPDEIAERIARVHRPYHDAIENLLESALARHGYAVLLDVHSMPPLPQDGPIAPPQVVIGDRFGRSAASVLTETAGATFAAAGLRVAYNAPYAGGHILDRHARPQRNVHALQLEFDRRLYLDDNLQSPGTGLASLAALLTEVARRLSDVWLAPALPVAAE